ncbi:hypothetical protein CSV60_08955 [Sporosarcina sp. P7]|nr:hypothetical protein CSV60_08955 [Sporosarcina sp. P7]
MNESQSVGYIVLLFSRSDQYGPQCGWPSIMQPIVPEVMTVHIENSFNRIRTEVRSFAGDWHLGYIFEDGPKDHRGLRYCINSASIEFAPLKRNGS